MPRVSKEYSAHEQTFGGFFIAALSFDDPIFHSISFRKMMRGFMSNRTGWVST